jgi:HPt (histidine-containing phosphotransfer) domain-containing protein
MKSINQIFKKNPELLDNEEVSELVEYCRELETEIIENKQLSTFSFEDKLAELVRDLNISINQLLKDDADAIRFMETERVNYEEAILNLKKYITNFSIENKFRL